MLCCVPGTSAISPLTLYPFLLFQRVVACGRDGNLTLGDPSEDGFAEAAGHSVLSASLGDDDENMSNACMICLDPFRVGDDVTWSKNTPECRHVFHEECLMEWLAHPDHNNCPSCRVQIIHVKEGIENTETNSDTEDVTDEDDDATLQNLAYVIMDGLISPLRRASSSLIGNSIEYSASFDDTANNDLRLRRVLSADAQQPRRSSLRRASSSLGIALRRVLSFDVYSQPSVTFDEDDDIEAATSLQNPSYSGDSNDSDPKKAIQLRRCRSEGFSSVSSRGRRRSSRFAGDLETGGGTFSDDEDEDDLQFGGRNALRPGLFRRFRRPQQQQVQPFPTLNGAIYSRLSNTFESADPSQEGTAEYDDDEEESLERRILEEEDDLLEQEMASTHHQVVVEKLV